MSNSWNDHSDQASIEKKKCALCSATEKLKTCASCLTTSYCSREHQLQHWKQHKPLCKQINSAASAAAVSRAAADSKTATDSGVNSLSANMATLTMDRHREHVLLYAVDNITSSANGIDATNNTASALDLSINSASAKLKDDIESTNNKSDNNNSHADSVAGLYTYIYLGRLCGILFNIFKGKG